MREKKQLVLAFLVGSLICLGMGSVGAQNTFPATGNVGIGTTTPSFLLDINGAARTQTRHIIGTTAIGAGVVATDKIVTDGGIRGLTYINFRPAVVGDNTQNGLWGSGASILFYHNNFPGVAFNPANGGVLSGSAMSFSPAYNPGAGTGDVYMGNFGAVFYPTANTSVNYYGLSISSGWQSPSYSNSLIGIFRGFYFTNNLYTTSTANDVRAVETNGGKVIFSGTVQQAVANLGTGVQITQTLPASANNDVLVGVDINPTFTNGAFTGVSNLALRVTGNVRLASLVNNNTQTRVVVSDASGNLSYRDVSTIGGGGGSAWSYNGNAVTAASSLGTTSNFDLPIITNNIERMRVGANGSVGIGTVAINDVNYKLFVENGIRTRKVKVDQGAWPDYVFSPDYPLLSISDLDKYIRQHQHLPEISPAEEVKQDGLDLGENQAMLLKKIEELVLYIIEQDKKIKSQDKSIQELKSDMEELQKKMKQLQTGQESRRK
jgi:hypothetical protein